MREQRERTRAREILAKRWGSTDRILGGHRFLHYRIREDQFFLEAMQEAFAYQFLGDPAFAELCRAQEVFPRDLRTLDGAWRIPSFPTQVSALDNRTRRRVGLCLRQIFGDLGLCSGRHTNSIWIGGPFPMYAQRGIESTSKSSQSHQFEAPDRGCLDKILEIGPRGAPLRLITDDAPRLLESLSPYALELKMLSPNSQLIHWTELPCTQPLEGRPEGPTLSTGDVGSAAAPFPLRSIHLRGLAGHPVPLAACPAGNFHLSRAGRIVSHPDGSHSFVSPIPRRGAPLRMSMPSRWIWQNGCECGRSSPWTGNNLQYE